jgi:sugar phosphate isomerase/epimerase
MARIPIGALVDSLGLPVREGLATAARLGFSSVQLGARGPVDPRRLDRTGRRDLARLIQRHGLKLTALAEDPGGRRLADPARVEEYLDRLKRALELSVELGAPLVTLVPGDLPTDPAAGGLVLEAIKEAGDFAERVGAVLALETAGEPTARLHALLASLNNPNLKAAFDPGRLLMAGRDPAAEVAAVADDIVAVHARDAVGRATGVGREVPLGTGELDYRSLLTALAEAGYHGVHTIRREGGDDPAAEVAAGKAWLERL